MSFFKLSVERVLGMSAMLLGITGILEGVRLYPIRTSPMVGDHTLPVLIGIFLVFLGALLTFFVKSRPSNVEYPSKQIKNKMIYSMGLMFLYLVLLKFLGYLIATFLIFIGLFRIFGSYKWIKCAALSVIAAVSCYYIFVNWLGMPFPAGIFDI